MLGKFKYSDREKELFKRVGLSDMMQSVDPATLYRMAMEKEFILNLNDDVTATVRRCIIALNGSTFFRLTPEWDKLIYLGMPRKK